MAQKKIDFMGLRAGTDIIYLLNSAFNENISNFEINGDIDLNRYLISYAYGTAGLRRSAEGFNYYTQGSYYKAGIDANFINNLEGHNAIFFGLQYARSDFNADVFRLIEIPDGGSIPIDITEDLSSFWFEARVGIKVNFWQNFDLGFTVSNRFLNEISGEQDLLAYEVPGYGHAEANGLWKFNYFIQYYLPFKKDKALK
ncbi:MAG: DUF6048 family protein [Cyclobacteriaceae bacterium]